MNPWRSLWAALLGMVGLAAISTSALAQTGLDFNSGATPKQYVRFTQGLSLSQYTVECWFRRDAAGTGAGTGTGGLTSAIPLVAKGAAEAEDNVRDLNYFLGISSTNTLCADFEHFAGSGNSPNHPLTAAGGAITNGVWYHAAFTYDGTTMRLYLNGTLVASQVVSQTPASATSSYVAAATTLQSNGTTTAGFFDGVLDEVRIWNYARSAAEILATKDAELAVPQTGLVARWAINEGAGTSIGACVGPAGTVFGTPSWGTGAPITAVTPGAPTGLAASAPSTSSIHLTWSDAACDETGFAIERSSSGSGGPFSPLATVGANVTSYDDNGLPASTNYCYQVRAVNSGVYSGYTSPACATTQALSTPPADPTGLTVTVFSNTRIDLAWTDNASNETGYEVERSTTGTGGPYSLLVTLAANATSYSNTGLTPSSNYCYRVRAVNGTGPSGYAGPSCATTAATGALDLSGSYVAFGDPPAVKLSTFTLETWFRRDGAGVVASTGSGGVSAVPLIAKALHESDGSNVDGNYFLGIDGSTGRLAADFEDMATGGNHPVFGTTAIAATSIWHHAAVTYDGTTWRVYLDGNLETTLAVNQTPRFDSVQRLGLGTAFNSGGTAEGNFDGALDEVRIWNYARTQAAIVSAANSQITTATSGLMALWALDEGSGTAVNGSAGTAVNGTITGASYTWIPAAPFNLVLPTSPADPSGLVATAVSFAQIDLTWADNSTNETGFAIERSTTGSGGPFAPLASVAANTTSYSDLGLTGSTEYCYRVRASNGIGNSGYSNTSCATTQAPPPPPAAPSDLAASAVTYGQIHLTWIDNATDETSFELERSVAGMGGPFTPLTTLAANAMAYDDLNLSGSSEYCYRVRAVNASGASAYAGPACATTPAPSSLALEFGTSGNNTTTYVTFGDPNALDLGQFTLECWFRRDGTGTTTTTGSGGIANALPLVTHGAPESDGSNVDMNYFLGINTAGNVLCADFEDMPGGANHPISGVTAIASGVWHHGAATYDGATWNLYLDGNLEAVLAVNQPPRSTSIQRAALATALTSGGAANGFFDGTIDEARVWNVARTAVEIRSTANSQLAVPQPNLAARWSLDEGAGTIVNGSPTGVNGTIVGSNSAWVTGAPFDLTFTPPAAPTALTATAPTYSLVALAWTDNASNETGFEIERSTTGIGGTYVTLATVPANTTSYSDNTLAPSAEYCYRVRAVNSSGSSDYAGPVCATTLSTGATALDLGGGGAYASFGNPGSLQLSTFTIELWLRRDGAGVGTNTGTGGIPDAIPLVAKGRAEDETPGVDINYLLGIRASDGVLCADFEEGAGGTSPSLNHPIVGVTPIAIGGGWHHAVATYDGIAWKLYLDGVLEASVDVGQPVASASTVAVALGSALTSGNVAAGSFDGAVDEVRIWNYARTQMELQGAANAQIAAPATGLVARWALDEGSGATFAGSAGTSINGTITGTGYSWIQPGAPFGLAFNHQPAPPTLVAPADGATGISTSPTLSVAVSDPDGDNVTVTWYGRPVSPSPGPDFTLIGLPDTQYYTGQLNGGTSAIFDAQADWVAANRVARNIAYVAHLGDCTEHGNSAPAEWARAVGSLSRLEPDNIPYGVCAGNHDQTPIGDADTPGSTDQYNANFGIARFSGRSYYGGHYGTNNDNWYDLFSASGMNFIVISLEYDTSPDAAVLAWADGLLTTYASRRAIVASHFIANTGNPAGFGPQGQAIYNALKGHPNLFLMLCGHVPGEGRRQDTYNGNTVHTLLSDYQGRTRGGDGWMRIMEFSPTNNAIRVRTYSPTLGQYEADADSSSQFTLPYNMVTTTPFTLIGTSSNVASGSTASITWPGLAPGTAYEWYAVVADGGASTVGTTSSFTTAPLPTYTLSAVADPVAGGSVSKSPDQATYVSGTSVTLTAVPNTGAGYHFVSWSGALTGTDNPQSLVMDGNKSVSATFALNTYTLTYTAGPGGSITGTTPQTVDHGASGSEVTATPNAGYHFVSWSDGVTTAARTDANVTADVSVTASFAIDTHTLTYLAGTGGSITGTTPQTVAHGGSGSEVTATPNAGYHFVSWSDGVTTASRTDADVTADLSVTASFAINTYTLAVSVDPADAGYFTVDPMQPSYEHGTVVQIQAYPAREGAYSFTGWTGEVTGTSTALSVTMDGDKTLVAHFVLNAHALIVAVEPPGSGAVARDPDLAAYGYEVQVTLTATPTAGWAFTSWCGDVTGSANPRSLAMIGDRFAVAIFNEEGAPLVEVISPNGAEILEIGASADLRWSASDAEGVASVDLLLSRDGPAGPYEMIAAGIANTGTYGWNVTGPLAPNAYLKVEAHNPTALTARTGPGLVARRLAASDGLTGRDISDHGFRISDGIVNVGGGPTTQLALGPVAPNPMVARSRFGFALPADTRVRLEVLDVNGRRVATIVDADFGAGRHDVTWNGIADHGGRAPAGLYIVRMTVAGDVITRRFVIVH